MPDHDKAHLNQAQLADLALGKLTDAQIDTIQSHLETCDTCRKIAREILPDSFVELVRSTMVSSEDCNSSEYQPTVTHDSPVAEPGENVLYAGIPLELAAHDKFRIVRELGRGGMGVVYQAEHRLMKRMVAIKVLTPRLVESHTSVERFRREVEAAAQLDHPNIVRAFDAEQAGALHLLVMEYVEGQTLAQILGLQGALPIGLACRCVQQAASGLAHAHEKKMIHRDIKPQNLFITEHGVLKILDFGLARLGEKQHDAGLTEENVAMGTPGYMAPEQATDARQADIRSDIYSLGCTLYFLLSGRPPFAGETAMQIILAHLTQEPPPLANEHSKVPAALAAVVSKMMAKLPDDRYQTPTEIVAALAPFIQQDGKINPGPRRKRLALAALAIATAVAASVWLATLIFRVETTNGTLVVEVNEPNAEVYVDGNRVTVSWDKGGKKAEIHIKPGTRKVEVKKAGFTVFGEEVTLEDGKRNILVAKLEHIEAPVPKKEVVGQQATVLDGLSRETIPLESLTLAGNGDPEKAPASLVGVLGDPVPFHADAILGLAYSGDGKWLASGSRDNTIHLRESATGQVKQILRGHDGAVSAVAFSKDSKTLVSASHDGSIKFWLVGSKEVPKTVLAGIGEIRVMALSEDGQFLAAGGINQPIKCWKWGEWDKPTDCEMLKGTVTSLSFSPDGESLAASWDGAVRFYATASGKVSRTWPAENSNRIIAFHGDGKWLVSTGDFVKCWEVSTGKMLGKLPGSGPYTSLALHPDGKHVYCSELSGLFGFLVDLPNLHRIPESGLNESKSFREPQGISTAAFSPKGDFIAFGTHSGGIHVWDYSTKSKQLSKRGHPHYVSALATSPDRRTLLSCGDDNALRRWDLSRIGENKILDKPELPLNDVASSPDGKKYITSASFWDHTSDMGIMWNAATGERLFSVEPAGKMFRFAFSFDGKMIAGCNDFTGCVHLWDANNGKELHRFPKVGVCSDRPSFSGDDKLLAVASHDTKVVKVWDVVSGKEVHSWESGPMCSVALSKDAKWLAAGHVDGSISLWNLTDKEPKEKLLTGHAAAVNTLRFTGEDNLLVSSSNDGTIRLWTPGLERSLRDVIPVGPPKRNLIFELDPTGRYLFVAGNTPLIYILRLPKREAAPTTAEVPKPVSPSAALEAFRRDKIPVEALTDAGDGDPARAPDSLVAVLGEVQAVHSRFHRGIAYSPDGRWLATGSPDKSIALRDTANDSVKKILKGHTEAISGVAFGKNGNTLVSAANDGTVRIWPLDRDEQPKVVEAKLDKPAIYSLAVSPDGRYVAVAGANAVVKIWKWGEWDKAVEIKDMVGKVRNIELSFSPDGERLACGGHEPGAKNASLRVYASVDGTAKLTLPVESSEIYGLAYSHDGSRLAVAGVVFQCIVLDSQTGKQLTQITRDTFPGEWPHFHNVIWSHDDKSLALVADYQVRVYSLPIVKQQAVLWLTRSGRSLAFSPNGDKLALGGYDGDVVVWDTANWKQKYLERGHRRAVWSIAVSPDGEEVLSLGSESAVIRWLLARPREPVVQQFDIGLAAPQPGLNSVAYGRDRDTCVLMGYRLAAMRNMATGKETIIPSPTFLPSSAVSPDGKTVAASGHGGNILFFDLISRKEVHRIPVTGPSEITLAFSRDGEYLAAGPGGENRVVVWNVPTGAERSQWKVHSPARAFAFAPDGKQLATGHDDGSIQIWEFGTGKKVRTLGGHAGRVLRLKYTPDGRTLVSSGEDGIMRVFNPTQERARAIIPVGPANRPLIFDLDPSGRYAIAASAGPLIYILRLPNDALSAK